MKNLNNVFILFTEEESKEISFLEDNKKEILKRLIFTEEKDSNWYILLDIKINNINKIMDLNLTFPQYVNNLEIDVYLPVLSTLLYDSNINMLIGKKLNENKILLHSFNVYVPICIFQDKKYFYMLILNGDMFILNKENNENIFHKLLMDMSL